MARTMIYAQLQKRVKTDKIPAEIFGSFKNK